MALAQSARLGLPAFKILGASYGAEYGFAVGGIVSLITKSGSDSFRGNGFGFFRDEALDARNYFATQNLVSPFSADPTVDLAGEAPDGKYFYLSMRGPLPLSGDPHASTGSTPGLMVAEVLRSAGIEPTHASLEYRGAMRADSFEGVEHLFSGVIDDGF